MSTAACFAALALLVACSQQVPQLPGAVDNLATGNPAGGAALKFGVSDQLLLELSQRGLVRSRGHAGQAFADIYNNPVANTALLFRIADSEQPPLSASTKSEGVATVDVGAGDPGARPRVVIQVAEHPAIQQTLWSAQPVSGE